MKKLFFSLLGFVITLPVAQAEWSLIPGDGDLAEKFKSGKFESGDFVKFGLYIIEMLIEVAGVVAVIMVMVGGYRYVIGSLSEDKEGGKNTLKYALIGFAVAVLAWLIVDFIITFLTT